MFTPDNYLLTEGERCQTVTREAVSFAPGGMLELFSSRHSSAGGGEKERKEEKVFGCFGASLNRCLVVRVGVNGVFVLCVDINSCSSARIPGTPLHIVLHSSVPE